MSISPSMFSASILLSVLIAPVALAQSSEDSVALLLKDWENEYVQHDEPGAWRGRTRERHNLQERLFAFGSVAVPEVEQYLRQFEERENLPRSIHNTLSAYMAMIPSSLVDETILRLYFDGVYPNLDYVYRRHRTGMPFSVALTEAQFEHFRARLENASPLEWRWALYDFALLSQNSVDARAEPILAQYYSFLRETDNEAGNADLKVRTFLTAIWLLGTEARAHVEELFANEDTDWMQMWKAITLSQLGNDGYRDTLVALVDDVSQHEVVRSAALEAYVHSVGRDAKDYLTRIVRDESGRYHVPVHPDTMDCMQVEHLNLKREAQNHLNFRIQK